MIASGFSVFFALMIVALIFIAIVVVTFFNRRLAAVMFFVLISYILLEHFAPIAAYEIKRWAAGGRHEREIDGQSYFVFVDENSNLEFTGSRHPSRISSLRFKTTVPNASYVHFGIRAIDARDDFRYGCPSINRRFELQELEQACVTRISKVATPDTVFETAMTENPQIQLKCYDPPKWEDKAGQNCHALFEIDRYEVWVWFPPQFDIEKWHDAFSHIEKSLGEHFSIVD